MWCRCFRLRRPAPNQHPIRQWLFLAPLGEQMDDLKYLVKASGFGNLNFIIKAQVEHFTDGIDRDRPSGMMMFFKGDDPEPQWLGFVAVEDVDDVGQHR